MLNRKTWISMFLISLLTLGSFNLAFAAPNGERGSVEPAQVAERLQKELDLTDEQMVQVKAIMTEQREKAQVIMEELKNLHNETKEMLSGVLTEEQMSKFEGMKDSRKARAKEKAKSN